MHHLPTSPDSRLRVHRPRRGPWRTAVATLVCALAITACGGGGDELVVYSGRHYNIELAFEQYTEETGVELEFLTGNDAELREKLAVEGDETPADVYITVDAGNLARAAEQGLFQPLESDVLADAIPAELSDSEGRWYGLTLRARTIVYNPTLLDVDDVPDTYEELAEPEWEGRVCMRNASNVYQQSLVASLIANHGEDEALRIVRGWADNAEIFSNDVLILEAINDGLCEVGVTNHYYLGRELDEHPDLEVDLKWANQDDRGVHVNISGGGVTAAADKPEEARAFLEWLATDGQEILVAGNHEYPANPDVPADALLASEFGTLDEFVRDPLEATVFGALNPDAIRLMDEAGYG